MKIVINIETQSPDDLLRVAQALGGVMAEAPASGKGSMAKPAPAKQDTAAASAPAATQASGAATSSSGQTATTAASPSNGAVPDEATLTAAANEAVAKVGSGGPAKVKSYIAANYQKDDGTPGTLKLTKADQRGALLAALQGIARGEITL